MTTNLDSLDWNTIFKCGKGIPNWPPELTKKWWDKNKQTLAKTRATGIGEELTKLADDFGKVPWFGFVKGSHGRQSGIKDARNLIIGSQLDTFRKQLSKVQKLAKSEAVIFSKGLTTKATGKTLEEMAGVADKMLYAITPSSLAARLEEAVKHWEATAGSEAIKKGQLTLDALALVVSNAPGYEKSITGALKDYLETPEKSTHQVLGTYITRSTRAMTTQLGNLVKSHGSGVPFRNYDAKGIEKLNEEMKPVANAVGSEYIGEETDKKAALQAVHKYTDWMKAYKRMTKDIEAGY